MSEILVPIPPADLIDRLTRMQLRSQEAADDAALLRHITQLQRAADHALPAEPQLRNLWEDLADTNADLFALDTDIRHCADRGDFGAGFVALARAIIATQDSRIRIKQEIGALLAATLPPYRGTGH